MLTVRAALAVVALLGGAPVPSPMPVPISAHPSAGWSVLMRSDPSENHRPGERVSVAPAVVNRPPDRICLPGNPACPPPDVTITPASGTFSTASQTITIEWCGHAPLSSRQIIFNGADVTTSFSFVVGTKTGCSSYRTSSGAVTLVTGGNTLVATTTDNIDQQGSASASYTLAAATPPQLTITPAPSGTVSVLAGQSGSTTFSVSNGGTVPVSATLAAVCATPALLSTPCTPSQSSMSLGGGTSTTISVSFQASSTLGSSTVTLTATNTAGPESWNGTREVSVAGPTPPISTAKNPGDVRDPSRCVVDCFEKVLAYSLPSYVSRDVERGVTLVYRSNQAHPVGTVVIDIGYIPSPAPLKISLKLQRPDGSFETFLNGRTELFFDGASYGGSLVGRFAAGGATRRVNYTAVVTSYFTGGTSVATTPAPVLIVNEENSPYGAGVTIAGVQRLYADPDGGVVITDGSGGATYHGGSCQVMTTCTYSAPVGDFSVLSTNGDGSYYRRYPDGTVVRFTGNGYHWTTTDRFGNATQFGYTWSDVYSVYALTSITDPAGFVTTLYYRDAAGAYGWKLGGLGSITGSGGRSASFGVDNSNNLLHWLDADGTYYAIAAYDSVHRMTQVQDHNNGVWNFAYAIDGSLSQIQAPLADVGGGVSQRPTTNITGPGVAVANALQAAPDAAVAQAVERRGSVTNPRGFSTLYLVNRFGAAMTTTDAIGRQASVEYNADGLPSRIMPVASTQSWLTWDGPRLTQVLRGNSQINYEYDPTYNQVKRIWGTTAEQLFTYDTVKAGRPLLTSRVASTPVDSATRYLFTADGRIQSQTDALGHGTTWTYSPTGFQNVTETRAVTAAGEKKTTFGYDGYGRTSSVTDPTGATSQTFYDARNRVTSTVGARADTTRFGFDGGGNVTTVTDARGRLWQYGRNVLGWTLTQTDPSNAVERFAYNLNGLVTTYTNRRNQMIATFYDSLDRVQSTYQYTEGQTTTYAYDPGGHWAAVSNGASTDTVKLNSNFLVEQQITVRPDFTRSVRTSYDVNQRRTGVNVLLNGVPGDSIVYGYGSAGQLSSITDPLGRFTSIGYNSDYQPNTFTFTGGLVATNTYSATHGLTGTSFNVSAVDQAFGRYYSQDSLTRVRESRDRQNKVRRFAYDPSGEMISHGDYQTYPTYCHFDKDYGRVCDQAPESYLGGRSYAYDVVGNPTDAGVAIGSSNRVTSIGGDAVEYDADGNITHRYRVGAPSTFEQTLTWNSLGQLTQVVTTRDGTTSTLQFLYDGFGRRIQRMIPLVGSMQYVWDGDQTVAETAWNGATARAYTYYPGTDHLHSVVTGGQTYYAASDAAGNVIGMINAATNAVSDIYAYQPFGLMERNDQNVPSSLRWKGLQYDAESGLYYMRARYYAPDLGRFVSEDPIGLAGGINQYRFAGNDPVNSSDPTGLWCVSISVWVFDISFGSTCDGDGGGRGGRPDGIDMSNTSGNFGDPNARGGRPPLSGPTGEPGPGDGPRSPGAVAKPDPGPSLLACVGNGTVDNFMATKEGVHDLIGYGGQWAFGMVMGGGMARAIGVPRIGGVALRYGAGAVRGLATGVAPELSATIGAWGVEVTGMSAAAAGVVGTAITAPLVYGALNFGYTVGSLASAIHSCAGR